MHIKLFSFWQLSMSIKSEVNEELTEAQWKLDVLRLEFVTDLLSVKNTK